VRLRWNENSDSGVETPVPRAAIRPFDFAQDLQHFRNPFDRLRTWQLFWQPV